MTGMWSCTVIYNRRMNSFQNPPDEEIRELLLRVRTIAVVGLSPRPNRPSHRVALHMQRFGYRIVPIRPAVDSVLGEKAYATLGEGPEPIDLVDVFRAPEHVDGIVEECLAAQAARDLAAGRRGEYPGGNAGTCRRHDGRHESLRLSGLYGLLRSGAAPVSALPPAVYLTHGNR